MQAITYVPTDRHYADEASILRARTIKRAQRAISREIKNRVGISVAYDHHEEYARLESEIQVLRADLFRAEMRKNQLVVLMADAAISAAHADIFKI